MTLTEYMARNKKTAADISRLSGVSAPRLSQFLSGRHGLSSKNIARIEDATDGAVTFSDLRAEHDALAAKAARRARRGARQ